MPRENRELIVRAILGLTGVVALATGANIGFGGIATLGLQGSPDFFQVTDPGAFAVKDSNVRFLGGLWLGLGLLFAASAIWLDRMRAAVIAALALMVVGGLSRLSAPDLSVLVSPQVIGSFLAEVFLMPILVWRVWLGGLRKRPCSQ
jgi:hypothetical protein